MRKVRITKGTYGYQNGSRIEPKDRRSEPFLLDDAEAARLVRLGVAEIVDEAVATPGEHSEPFGVGKNPPERKNALEGITGDLDERPDYSVDSDVKDLRAIAKKVGITFKIGMSKKDMVKSLDAHFDDEMPDLSAAPPVK